MVARILVVEDNPFNLKLMRDVLEYQGFEVLTAAVRRGGGRRGLEQLAGPGADGPATARDRWTRSAVADAI